MTTPVIQTPTISLMESVHHSPILTRQKSKGKQNERPYGYETPENSYFAESQEDEPTIVVSSDDENDKVFSSFASSDLSKNKVYETYENLSPKESNAVQSLRLWISVARDFSARQQVIPSEHSFRVCAVLNSLRDATGVGADCTFLLEDEILNSCFSLVESFSSFCSNVDGSFSVDKVKDLKRKECSLREIETNLSRNSGLLGCFNLILTVIALPHSTLLRKYSKSNTLLLFMANFLSHECLRAMEHYLHTISLKKHKGSNTPGATMDRFYQDTKNEETTGSVSRDWIVSVLHCLVLVIHNLWTICLVHTLPSIVLRGLITFLAHVLQFRSTAVMKRKSSLLSREDIALDHLHQASIALLVEVYRRFEEVSCFIETLVVELVASCIPSASKKGKHFFFEFPLVVLFLRLPQYFCGESLMDHKSTLCSVFMNFHDSEKTVRNGVELVKATIRRLCLELVKHYLILSESYRYDRHEEKPLPSMTSAKRDRLGFLVRCFCQASLSFLYPTALLYVEEFFHFFVRCALANSKLSPTDKTCEFYNVLTSALGIKESDIGQSFHQSCLILLGQMCPYFFNVLEHYGMMDCSKTIHSHLLAQESIQNKQNEGGNHEQCHQSPECSTPHLREESTATSPLQSTQHSSLSTLPYWVNRSRESPLRLLIQKNTLPILSMLHLDSFFQNAVDTPTNYLHNLSYVVSPQDDTSTTVTPCYTTSSVCFPYIQFLFEYDTQLHYVQSMSSLLALHNKSCVAVGSLSRCGRNHFTFNQNFNRRKMYLAILAYCVLNSRESHHSISGDQGRGESPKDSLWKPSSDIPLNKCPEDPTLFSNTSPAWNYESCLGLLAIEMLLTCIPLCLDRVETLEKSKEGLCVYEEPGEVNHSKLTVLWEQCLVHFFSSLASVGLKMLVLLQDTQTFKADWTWLLVLEECCVEYPFLLIHSSYGLRFVDALLKGFTHESSRCCIHMLIFFFDLWGSLKRQFPHGSAMTSAIVLLDSVKRGPYHTTTDEASENLPFLNDESVSPLVFQMTQETNRLFQLEDSEPDATPKQKTKTLGVPKQKKNLGYCLRVLEILLRLFLPAITAQLETKTTSTLVHFHSFRVLKQIVLDCPPNVSFVPWLVSMMLRYLPDPNETYQGRVLVASVFTTFYFQPLVSQKIKPSDCCTTHLSEKCKARLDCFVKTLVRFGEFHPSTRRHTQEFSLSTSLKKFWDQLEGKLKKKDHYSFAGAKKKRISWPATKHKLFTGHNSNESDHDESAVITREPQMLIDRKQMHTTKEDRMDGDLPILAQIVLYGWNSTQNTVDHLDLICEWFLAHFLIYFRESSCQENEKHSYEEAPERSPRVLYLKSLEKVFELRPLNLSFVESFLCYFQQPPDTQHSVVFMAQLCHLIYTTTWNYFIARRVETPSSLPCGSSVSHPHIFPKLLKDYSLLEDFLLECLIPSTSRFLISAATKCLCVSVKCITHHFKNGIEPLLVDSVSFLLPFLFWIKRYPMECNKEKLFVCLIRHGITALTRNRTELKAIHVQVDLKNVALLRKQCIFLCEGLKRRIWILSIMSSFYNFDTDLTKTLGPFHDFVKTCINESKQTSNPSSFPICTTPKRVLVFYNTTLLDYIKTHNLMSDGMKTASSEDKSIYVLENWQHMLSKLASDASTMALADSRLFHGVLQSILKTFRCLHNVFNSSSLEESFAANILDWIFSAVHHMNRKIFFLFLDVYEHLPSLIYPPYITFQDVLKIQMLLVQCLGSFCQTSQGFLIMPRLSDIFMQALQAFQTPSLQLIATQTLTTLLASACQTMGKTFQAVMNFSEPLLIICRGYTLTKETHDQWAFQIAWPQAFSSSEFSFEFFEEYKLLQRHGFHSFSLLSEQGLSSPFVHLELAFALLFHMNPELRHQAIPALNALLGNTSVVETFLLGRLGTLIYHGFTTMMISCFIFRKHKIQNVCSLCGVLDLFSPNAFDASLFVSFYENQFRDHPEMFQHILSTLITLLQRGLESQFGAVVLTFIPPPFGCQCSAGFFLKNLMCTFTLSSKEAFYFLIHILFFQWVSHLLKNFCATTHPFAQSCLHRITSYVFNQLTFLSTKVLDNSSHSLGVTESMDSTLNPCPSGEARECPPLLYKTLSPLDHILRWNIPCGCEAKDPNEQFLMASCCHTRAEKDSLENQLVFHLDSPTFPCDISLCLLSVLLALSLLFLLQLGYGIKECCFPHVKERPKKVSSQNPFQKGCAAPYFGTKSCSLNSKHVSLSPPSVIKIPIVQNGIEKLFELLSLGPNLPNLVNAIQSLLNDVIQHLHVADWEHMTVDQEESYEPVKKRPLTRRLSSSMNRPLVKRISRKLRRVSG